MPALREIALKIGADVPACLSDKAVFVSGIGENVEEAPAVPLTPVVLVNPNIALSTPAVFKNRKGDFDKPMRMEAADFAPENFVKALSLRANGLQNAAIALVPEIKAVLNALENLKKTDQRYRNWQRSCQITATVLSVLMLLSVFSVWLGFQLRGREQNGQYAELIAQADALIDSQQYEESLPLLTEAVSLEDDRIEAYVRLATILYRLGRYDACIDTLSGLNFTADDSAMNQQEFEYAQAELNYVLGSCYYQKENYENAVRCMELAVWFAPEESAYYRDLSVAQALSGDLKAARKTYEAMEALDHAEKDDLLLVESELDFAEGRYEAALTPLQQLLRSENQDLVNRSCLLAAQCCQRLGTDWLNQEISLLEEGRSLLDVSRADAVREQLADAYLRRGVETGSAADYEKALRELDNLLNRQVASLPVLLDKGLALQYLGRSQEAVSVLEEAVSRYPNDYRGYLRLALLYLTPAAYDADRAVDFYQQAAALYKGANAQNSEFQYLESLIQSLTG